MGKGSVSEASFDLIGLIDGTGTLAMNTGAAFGSYWTAPGTGKYTATATYYGYGGYNYTPRDNEKREFSTCFESTLSAINGCEEVVASNTQPDLRHGNNGLTEEAAGQLLEFLAIRLITPYLGIIGRFVAKRLISWAIELDLREPTEGSFFIDPMDPHRTDLTFHAEEGETYFIQYTPSVGFVGEMKTDWVLTSDLGATYNLNSLTIQKSN